MNLPRLGWHLGISALSILSKCPMLSYLMQLMILPSCINIRNQKKVLPQNLIRSLKILLQKTKVRMKNLLLQ